MQVVLKYCKYKVDKTLKIWYIIYMEKYMKKILFISIFSVLTFSVYGQQFLWSTVRGNDSKYVPLNNVTREVLEFYDQYRFYLDYSGFTKDRFIEMFDYGFEGWD